MKCKICNTKTKLIFNINFKAMPICESCASAIFIQQATFYTKLDKKYKKCLTVIKAVDKDLIAMYGL